MRTFAMLCLAVIALDATAARADISIPPERNVPAEKTGTPLVIQVEEHKPARLIIPRKLLGEAAARRGAMAPSSATVVAGISLALAAVSLGFIGRRSRRAVVGAVLLLATTTGALAWADLAPPPSARRDDGDERRGRKLKVAVEVVDEGESIQLILPEALHVEAVRPAGAPLPPSE